VKYELSDAKSWTRSNMSGYIAVVFTPYDEAGDLDEAAIRKDIDYTLSLPSIGGLYVGSIYQEFWLLTQAERKRLAEIVLDAAAGRVPVLVSASHTNPILAADLAEHAAAAGADLVMLWPPYFGPRSDQGVLDFYGYVLSRVPVGFAFYNSGLSEVGYQMSPRVLRELATHPQMCMLKEASLRLDTYLQTIDLVGNDVLVSSPLEEFWLVGRMLYPDIAPEALLGSSRALFLQTPQQPRLHEFYLAAQERRWADCQSQLSWILSASEALHGSSLRAGSHPVGLIKALRQSFGQSGGVPRPPCPEPDPADLAAAIAGLRGAGLNLP
jgi:4-hydroxy-tetrahydrodipicolinate synthase